MSADSNEKDESFVSSLSESKAAFLAEVSEKSLALGERSPDDFLAQFSCEQIMLALKDRPQERAEILKQATGTHEKIAPRMSAKAAGETLQIALDEKVTDAKQIVELFKPDDRQRYLKSAELWAFAVSGQPEQKLRKGADLERAKKYVTHLLERALHHKLFDQKELVASLTVSRLTTLLPPQLLAAIIEASLDAENKFSHADLLEIAPPEKLVAHVPLDYIWEKVVTPLVAERSGYAGGGEGEVSGEGDDKDEPEIETSDSEERVAQAKATEEIKTAEEAEADAELDEALEAAEDEVEAEELGDEEEMVLDDDDDEVHTVTDDDDVFDDLIEEGLADDVEVEPTSGPSLKRTLASSEMKKNANVN
jgi:hypothetical protein